MADILPTPSAKDLDLLRSARRERVGWTLITTIFLLVAFLFLSLCATYIFQLRFGESSPPRTQRMQLANLGHQWSSDVARELELSSGWLQTHGTATEAALFQGLSGIVVESMLRSNSATAPEDELTSFSRIFLAIHISVVRLLFYIIASFRLCIAVGLLAFVRGMSAWKPYRNPDALGQMGNGRVFYSGAYAALEAVSPEGVPDKLIRGFACPQACSLQEAKSSQLWQLLSSFKVATQTNLALTQILVKNRSTACYVAPVGEEDRLHETFKESDLVTNAAALLNAFLRVHGECQTGEHPAEPTATVANNLGDPRIAYSERVATALRNVLTPTLREALATIPPAEIATFVLAFETGKVLAYSFEGERWIRRSNFVHLSARAVLHSLVEYPQEVNLKARTRIRSALVYAARKSPFAPIRLPVDFDATTLALRQWAEVLLACPHELPDVAVELELFALVRDAQTEWREHLFHGAVESFSALQSCGFATRTNLLFLPLATLVSDLRLIVRPLTLERMRALLQSLAAAQARVAGNKGEEQGSVVPTLSFDRVHRLPSMQTLTSRASTYGVQTADLHDWLVLRYVLSSFGWLASRVGDYSVPETGVVFAVFQANPPLTGANSHGRLGKLGMVPLRGSKVREQLGSGWSSYFTQVERATIAETEKDYERLLQGIEERVSSDEVEQGITTTAEPRA